MPDHDDAPDPVDQAYAQAEAMLRDEAARAARRARVLGAVVREAQAPPPVVSKAPKQVWGRGGWLAAACVAGLSVFVGLRLYPSATGRQEPPPMEAPIATRPTPSTDVAAPAAARGPAPESPSIVSRAKTSPVQSAPAAEASAHPPRPAPTPQADASAAAPPAASGSREIVVTGSRVATPLPLPQAQSRFSAAPAVMEASPPAPPLDKAARLRAAASAGRIAELRALLAEGAPVDAPDDDGETALMKSIRANHPAAAALLRQHGADLDVKNNAGASAREMATSMGDPELNRALGLAR